MGHWGIWTVSSSLLQSASRLRVFSLGFYHILILTLEVTLHVSWGETQTLWSGSSVSADGYSLLSVRCFPKREVSLQRAVSWDRLGLWAASGRECRLQREALQGMRARGTLVPARGSRWSSRGPGVGGPAGQPRAGRQPTRLSSHSLTSTRVGNGSPSTILGILGCRSAERGLALQECRTGVPSPPRASVLGPCFGNRPKHQARALLFKFIYARAQFQN